MSGPKGAWETIACPFLLGGWPRRKHSQFEPAHTEIACLVKVGEPSFKGKPGPYFPFLKTCPGAQPSRWAKIVIERHFSHCEAILAAKLRARRLRPGAGMASALGRGKAEFPASLSNGGLLRDARSRKTGRGLIGRNHNPAAQDELEGLFQRQAKVDGFALPDLDGEAGHWHGRGGY